MNVMHVLQRLRVVLFFAMVILFFLQVYGGDVPAYAHSPNGSLSGELKVWHKITLGFDGPFTSEVANPNPFTDYRLDVTFTNGSKTYVVPGYYATDGNAANTGATSGNVWLVHFSPDETGTWTWSASFKMGTNVAQNGGGVSAGYMDGKTGSFIVSPTDKTGRDLRGKGRLQYVGKHHLRFAETGEYFLKVGADAPENLLAYADFDGAFKTDGQKDELIKTWEPHIGDWTPADPTWAGGKGKGLIGAINYLASKGMNAFSFLTMNINGDDRNVFPYLDYNERYRMDVSRLAQWEVVFEHATKKGMYLHFKTQETENDQLLDGGALGLQRKLYYRELIARFGHHLALNWNLGEETTNTTSELQSFAQFFYDVDPYHHNIVLHTYPDQQELRYRPLLGDKSKLTGVSIQIDKTKVHSETKKWVDESSTVGKPWVVANDEQGGANDGVLPDANDYNHDIVRKEVLWGNIMAGGAGVEYYFGYAYPNSDLTCQDWRSRDNMWNISKYALDFFQTNNIPFHEMICDNNISSNTTDYCFYKSSEVYVVFLKNGGTTDLNLTDASGTYSVKWFNPRSVGILQDGSVKTVNGGAIVSLGNPPSDTSKDWVILVGRTENNPITYTLTVNNGSGDGNYAAGAVVQITADAPQSGYEFDKWIGDVANIENVNSASTSITMPLANVTVTATYKEVGTVSTILIQPSDDAYLQGTTRYNDNYLKVEYNKRVSYLKFAVSGLNGCQVKKATLKLQENGDIGNGTIRVFTGSHNNWTENNLSTSNAPSENGQVGMQTGSVSSAQVVSIDVSPLISGDGIYTMILKMDSGGNDVWFGSKESNRKPQLEVVVEEIEENPSTYTLMVNSGSGDGNYAAGAVVQITADAPQSGYEFDKWTGDVANIANVNSASTSITMPLANVTVTATYKQVPPPEPPPIQSDNVVFAINAGGYDYTGTDGVVYLADTNFLGGKTYAKSGIEINGTDDDVIYRTERYGNFQYSIPLQNGEYDVLIKLAEIYWTTEGKRVFDIIIQGESRVVDLDIFSHVGTANAFDILLKNVPVNDGELLIEFFTKVDNAKVSAILVREASAPFKELNGMVIMESENCSYSAAGTLGHEWIKSTDYEGFSGLSAMEASPKDNTSFRDSITGPRLDFEIEFETIGFYQVWIRMLGPTTASNSVHAGLDGLKANVDGGFGISVPPPNGWDWINVCNGVRVVVKVDNPGVHTLNVWMREAGVLVDKILLTQDDAYVPEGFGPSESERQ